MNAGFHIHIEGSYFLTLDEIWPDGDAPGNPTAEMVAERMREYGPMYRTLRDWCLEPQTVEVYGESRYAVVWGTEPTAEEVGRPSRSTEASD